MTPSSIIIRSTVADDVDAIERFIEPFVQLQQLLPRTRAEIALLARHGFVAEYEAQIVGFAAVEIYSQKLAELQCLAVLEQYRQQGIGRRLVEQCITRAREQNVRELMAITASEQLFVDCGFDYSLPNQKRALFVQTG